MLCFTCRGEEIPNRSSRTQPKVNRSYICLGSIFFQEKKNESDHVHTDQIFGEAETGISTAITSTPHSTNLDVEPSLYIMARIPLHLCSLHTRTRIEWARVESSFHLPSLATWQPLVLIAAAAHLAMAPPPAAAAAVDGVGVGVGAHSVFVYGSLMQDEVVRTIIKRVPPSSPALLPN